MYNNIICGENINIRLIEKSDLDFIYNFYDKYDKYVFAFGINKGKVFRDMTNFIALREKYNKFQGNIFHMIILARNTRIGIIKFSIIRKNKLKAWINFFALDEQFQNKNFGTNSLNLLEKFFKKINIDLIYISVIENNKLGYNF